MSAPPLTWQTWRFEPWDTWFFKAAEPWDAPGAHGAETLFPPLPRTVTGAIRHAMGEHLGMNWSDLAPTDGGESMRARRRGARVPDASAVAAFERMRIMGPYILRNGERLYPTPEALILGEDDDGLPKLVRLTPDRAVRTDLGRVRLPTTAIRLRDVQNVSDTWLTTSGMSDFLFGVTVVKHGKLVQLEDFMISEPRIGIAINKNTRTAEDAQLFNTVHARLKDGVKIAAAVSGFANGPPSGNVHFGGEGRMASFRTDGAEGNLPSASCAPDPEQKGSRRIVIVFVTAAAFGGDWRDSQWIPNWVRKTTGTGDNDCWVLSLLNDITVRVESACVPKYVYEGGYDVAAGQDRPVRALLPAGSVWFCEVLEWRRKDCDPTKFDLNDLIKRLHGKQLGSERELGRGEIAVGFWR